MINETLIMGERQERDMQQVFKRIKLGSLTLSGFILVVFGAAGYASFAETDQQCFQDTGQGQYITGTFIPEQKNR